MSAAPARTPRLAALRYRDFRLLWCGGVLANVGAQMQLIAVNWHVYQLLKGASQTLALAGWHLSVNAGALGLGMLGLVRVVPILLFALVGGLFADAFDRRRVIIGTQLASALVAALLAAVTLAGHASVPALYLLTAAGAAIAAFDEPAQQALVPHLVPREHLTNAVSLYMLLWQIGTIAGPALAGLIVARLAIGAVYALSAAGFMVAAVSIAALRYRGRIVEERPRLSIPAVLEGLRFTYGTRLIWSTMLLDFFATFFASARTMLPIVADALLHVGAQGYGLLATAQPVGAVLTGIAVSLRRDIRRQGPALLFGVAVYGAATALFGLSTIFALSYVLFALTGAGDTISTVIRATIRQTLTPDAVRGRMSSVHMMLAMGGPQLGELEAGLVAAVCGAPAAIVSGGLLTVALTAWVAWRWPDLRAYVHRPHPPGAWMPDAAGAWQGTGTPDG